MSDVNAFFVSCMCNMPISHGFMEVMHEHASCNHVPCTMTIPVMTHSTSSNTAECSISVLENVA